MTKGYLISPFFAVGENTNNGEHQQRRSAVAGVFTGKFSYYIKPNKSF